MLHREICFVSYYFASYYLESYHSWYHCICKKLTLDCLQFQKNAHSGKLGNLSSNFVLHFINWPLTFQVGTVWSNCWLVRINSTKINWSSSWSTSFNMTNILLIITICIIDITILRWWVDWYNFLFGPNRPILVLADFRVSSTTITTCHRHQHLKPRFTLTQVRSLGMPFGGCKESGTGMEGTRYTTFNKRSSHWNLNRIPNFVCMSCMYIVHCTETRSWCVFVFLFCVHVCLPGCLTILVYVY